MSDPLTQNVLPPTINLVSLVKAQEISETNAMYATVASTFSTPLIGGTATLNVVSSIRFATGVYIYVASIGIFKITATPTPTTLTVENIDAPSGVLVATGTVFNTCAPPTAESLIPFSDVLATDFGIPTLGATSTLNVVQGGWFKIGGWVYIVGAGWFYITSINISNESQCSLTVLNVNNSYSVMNKLSGTITAGAVVFPVSPVAYYPDNITVKAYNTPNLPGNAVLSVGEVIPKFDNPVVPTTSEYTAIEAGTFGVDLSTFNLLASQQQTLISSGKQLFSSAFKTHPVIQISVSVTTASSSTDHLGDTNFFAYKGVDADMKAGFYFGYSRKGTASITTGFLTVHWTAIGLKDK